MDYHTKPLNRAWKRRAEILQPYVKAEIVESSDYLHFDNVPLSVMDTLLEENFISPEETQNNALSLQEFIDFVLSQDVEFTFHGYLIGIGRDDYRVSIEGVAAVTEKEFPYEVTLTFTEKFKHADTIEAEKIICSVGSIKRLKL